MKRSGGGREIERTGGGGHIAVALRINCEGDRFRLRVRFAAAAAEIGGKDRMAVRTDLKNEKVGNAVERGLDGIGQVEIGRAGGPGNPDVPAGIGRYRLSAVWSAPP